MARDIRKRAKWLDNLRSKGIAEKLTLEEAQNIVDTWGEHLELIGAFRIIFGFNIPKSSLPYPIEIIQGAINKMEAYYHEFGQYEMVKTLEETEVLLVQYVDDKEALEEMRTLLNKKDLIDSITKVLSRYQLDQVGKGYLVNKKLWKLGKGRMSELMGSD